MAAVIAVGLTSGRMRYHGDIDSIIGFVVLLWACGHAAQMTGCRGLDQALKLASVLVFAAIVTAAASAVLSTMARPWSDSTLVEVDRILFGHHSWPDILTIIVNHEREMIFLSFLHESLDYQPFVLIGLLCLLGKDERAWRFVTAWAVALAACLVVFPWAPGRGAYVYFGVGPQAVQGVWVMSAWHYPRILEALRNGTTDLLSCATLEGLITMPSFHACAAVLLAWGFGAVPWLRWPLLFLNALMWISAVPIGGHYLVDVLAGTAVAAASLVASGLLMRRPRSATRPSVSFDGPHPGHPQPDRPIAIAA